MCGSVGSKLPRVNNRGGLYLSTHGPFGTERAMPPAQLSAVVAVQCSGGLLTARERGGARYACGPGGADKTRHHHPRRQQLLARLPRRPAGFSFSARRTVTILPRNDSSSDAKGCMTPCARTSPSSGRPPSSKLRCGTARTASSIRQRTACRTCCKFAAGSRGPAPPRL